MSKAIPKRLSQDQVAAWLRDEHGDSLESYTRVSTPAFVNPALDTRSTVSVSPLGEVLVRAGRDASDRMLLATTSLFVLSPSTFRVVDVGGLSERPKRTSLEVLRDDLSVQHADVDGTHELRFRCWIVDLPDGRFIADGTAIVRKGEPTPWAESADRFLAALGSAARPIG